MPEPNSVSDFRPSGSGYSSHPVGSPNPEGPPQWPSPQSKQEGLSVQLWIVLGVLFSLGLLFMVVVGGVAVYMLYPASENSRDLWDVEQEHATNPVLVREVGTVSSIKQITVMGEQGDKQLKRYFVQGSKASDYILVLVRKNANGSESILSAHLGSELKQGTFGPLPSDKPFIELGYKKDSGHTKF